MPPAAQAPAFADSWLASAPVRGTRNPDRTPVAAVGGAPLLFVPFMLFVPIAAVPAPTPAMAQAAVTGGIQPVTGLRSERRCARPAYPGLAPLSFVSGKTTGVLNPFRPASPVCGSNGSKVLGPAMFVWYGWPWMTH